MPLNILEIVIISSITINYYDEGLKQPRVRQLRSTGMGEQPGSWFRRRVRKERVEDDCHWRSPAGLHHEGGAEFDTCNFYSNASFLQVHEEALRSLDEYNCKETPMPPEKLQSMLRVCGFILTPRMWTRLELVRIMVLLLGLYIYIYIYIYISSCTSNLRFGRMGDSNITSSRFGLLSLHKVTVPAIFMTTTMRLASSGYEVAISKTDWGYRL